MSGPIPSDIEIADAATLQPIIPLAQEKLDDRLQGGCVGELDVGRDGT